MKIPNSVIGVVADVLANSYKSHARLNNLFLGAGAPGDPPEGNCEHKCRVWLQRCNAENLNALEILGIVLQPLMDQEPDPFTKDTTLTAYQERVRHILSKNRLVYHLNGRLSEAGLNPETQTLANYIKTGNYQAIEDEFQRATQYLLSDPHAAITAASSLIEATCKSYIETFNLEMPNRSVISNLWHTVRSHLGLNQDTNIHQDQRKIIQGLFSIVDGVGSLRTHIGSAHGRGLNIPVISISEARLSVNAAHAVVTFIMDCWHRDDDLSVKQPPF